MSALNSLSAVRNRVIQRFAFLQYFRYLRRWRLLLWAAISAFVAIFVYIPDVFTTQTYSDAIIINTSQNSNNWVVKFQTGQADAEGLKRTIEVRNVRQMSDFHFVPDWLQEKASSLAVFNTQELSKPDGGHPKTAVVRLSGLGLGDAHRSANITQLNPGLPPFLYNIIGALLVVVYWTVLLVGLPSLVLEISRPGRSAMVRYVITGFTAFLVLLYVIDFFYI